MDLKQLRNFIAVAEELSFRGAAKRLDVAQPPLSQSIKRLEAEIGIRLLDRTSRQVRLTPAGTAFLEEARRSVDQLTRAVATARRVEAGGGGHLRLGYVNAATYGVLPELLNRFRSAHAGVEFDLQESTSFEMLKLLGAGQLDAAVVSSIPSLADKFHAQIISRDRLVVALAPDHPLAARDELALADLTPEPFVMFSASRGPATIYQRTLLACREASFAPRIAHHAENIQSILGLVASHLGIAMVPEGVAKIAYPQVSFRPLADPSPTLVYEIALAWRRDTGSPAREALVAAARGMGALTA
jgi:DNA-binding transcriptional LysR family regulator